METENRNSHLLTKRLQAVADLVTQGLSVADIGCDHGYVSIYLVQTGISPKVIAMDVNEGPCMHARSNIAFHGLKNQIEVRLSNGTEKLLPGEVECMVIAGMGGRLMWKIMKEGMPKIAKLKELVLQPQSDVPQFRKNLREAGFEIIKENMIFEDGKYYPMMCVSTQRLGEAFLEKENQELFDTYGEHLLTEKNPVLHQFLQFEQEHYQQILSKLPTESKRYEEIKEILQLNKQALHMF